MTPLADEPDLILGSMTLRPSSCELVHAGGVEVVEPQVMRVLLALGRNAGRVLSRDALVEQCWDGRAISEDAINRVISRLRKLATVSGAYQLKTIRAVGYRLDPVGAAAVAPPAAAKAKPPVRWPMTLAALAILAAVGFVFRPKPDPAPAAAPAVQTVTLAVSPFSIGGDKADAGVAATVNEQLRTTLSHMQGLTLVDGGAGAPAALVLGGSVSHRGGAPLISLALTDRRSGARLWSAAFDGAAMASPTAPERAVSAATRFLAIKLGDGLGSPAAAREPADPETVRLVAQGKRLFAQANAARHDRDVPTFLRLFKQVSAISAEALQRDPGFAGAQMLAYQLDASPVYAREGESADALEARLARAQGALSRALAADPDDPEVLVAAALDYRQALRFGDAERLLERAVAIDPNSPDANTWYAYHLGLMNRCAAGLKYARIAAALSPEEVWRQFAVPRLLQCDGQREAAASGYAALMRAAPGNVFLLHEVYLARLGERNAAALRALRGFETGLRKGAPPPQVAQLLVRSEAAADAVEGRPGALIALLDADAAAITRLRPGDTVFGRTREDGLFVLALEYAHAGRGDRALETLRAAVEAGSLYLPWALPQGSMEFPAPLRAMPAYAALWKSSPGLSDLMARRAAAKNPQPPR